MNEQQLIYTDGRDGKVYRWPPPNGFWEASDGRWYPPTVPPTPARSEDAGYAGYGPHAAMAGQARDDRPWWQKKRYAIPIAAVVFLAFLGAVSGGDDSQDGDSTVAGPSTEVAGDAEEESTPDDESAPAEESATTTTEAPTTTTTEAPSTEIEAGTYVVGAEVPPGVYRVAGYWETLDESQDIIANDGVYDNGLTIAVVTDQASLVQFSGRAIPIEDASPVSPVDQGLTEGTYLVGFDIEPGQYRVSDPGYAYAARLDSGLDIVDNEGNEGSVILTVMEGDFAFQFTGTLERIS